jgi:hypothetical protein
LVSNSDSNGLFAEIHLSIGILKMEHAGLIHDYTGLNNFIVAVF